VRSPGRSKPADECEPALLEKVGIIDRCKQVTRALIQMELWLAKFGSTKACMG